MIPTPLFCFDYAVDRPQHSDAVRAVSSEAIAQHVKNERYITERDK